MRLPHLFCVVSLLLLVPVTRAGAWPIEMGMHGTWGPAATHSGDDGNLDSRGASTVGMRVAMPTRRPHWRQWAAFDSRRERLVHPAPAPDSLYGVPNYVDRTLELHEYSLMIGADRVFGPDSGFRRFVGFGAGYGTGRVTRISGGHTAIANTMHVLALVNAGVSFRAGHRTDVEIKVVVLGGDRASAASTLTLLTNGNGGASIVRGDKSPSGLFHREQFSIGLVWPLELPGAR